MANGKEGKRLDIVGLEHRLVIYDIDDFAHIADVEQVFRHRHCLFLQFLGCLLIGFLLGIIAKHLGGSLAHIHQIVGHTYYNALHRVGTCAVGEPHLHRIAHLTVGIVLGDRQEDAVSVFRHGTEHMIPLVDMEDDAV